VLYNKVKGTCLAFFSIFTRIPSPRRLFVLYGRLRRGAEPAMRRLPFTTICSLVVRPIFHLDPGYMDSRNGLDNAANLLYTRDSVG
jgi:hypothetical protein